MSIIETSRRTFTKAFTWRIVAVINSWVILSINLSKSNFANALLMNVTGFIAFYFSKGYGVKLILVDTMKNNTNRPEMNMEKEIDKIGQNLIKDMVNIIKEQIKNVFKNENPKSN